MKTDNIKRLPIEFKGKGDVSNYYYTQVYKHKCNDGKYAYIYKQTDASAGGYIAGYEVIKPIVANDAKMEIVDGKRKFIKYDTLKEFYPSTNQWGIYGFTCKTIERAMEKIAKF